VTDPDLLGVLSGWLDNGQLARTSACAQGLLRK